MSASGSVVAGHDGKDTVQLQGPSRAESRQTEGELDVIGGEGRNQ